jgi:polysaccharide pyruvyl transferase WcaK-like protein
MRVCLFDPSLENNVGTLSSNLGDLIIHEAVHREISSLFKGAEITRISTHSFPSRKHISLACNSDLIIVGGTNLLNSKMKEFVQWKIGLRQKFKVRRAVLLGVGWRTYQADPELYTKLSLRAVLNERMLHSVRDSYTKLKLENAGIRNVINTGCPTMWPFSNFNFDEIPKTKAELALVMLTDYRQSPELDKKLIHLVMENYQKVVLWPQGREDANYILKLLASEDFPIVLLGEGQIASLPRAIHQIHQPVILLQHSWEALQNFVNSDINFDYIGTRLHGGVKCLLSKRRSIIVEVDNRAKEIASDTQLPTVKRDDFDYIQSWINSPTNVNIKINSEAIAKWKSQFDQFKLSEDCTHLKP